MSMFEATPTSFINLDVDLKATRSLADLAEYLAESVSILSNDFFGENYYLCMEPELDEGLIFSAHHCTEYMLKLLEQLPLSYNKLLSSCFARVFDYGIDSGFKDNEQLTIDFTPMQLTRMAKLGITVRITVYPYHSERILRAPTVTE